MNVLLWHVRCSLEKRERDRDQPCFFLSLWTYLVYLYGKKYLSSHALRRKIPKVLQLGDWIERLRLWKQRRLFVCNFKTATFWDTISVDCIDAGALPNIFFCIYSSTLCLHALLCSIWYIRVLYLYSFSPEKLKNEQGCQHWLTGHSCTFYSHFERIALIEKR